jgi:hypothetical protein
MAPHLLDQIVQRRPGICLYGLAPPKRTSTPDQLSQIAAQQVERLRGLDLDGVIVYDIQDEAERTAEPRPFPFLPTLPPAQYADVHLSDLALPKIVYRCVASETRESFVEWLDTARGSQNISVLVGAPSRHASGGLNLRDAYTLVAKHAPGLMLGGITIAERHERSQDEHERILSKSAAGCRFFVTQAVYDVTSTLSLISDYTLALRDTGDAPLPIVLENELRFAADPLESSVRLCERIFLEVWSYALEKGVPLGVNIESVSIRKAEIDASISLVQTLRAHMLRSLGSPSTPPR